MARDLSPFGDLVDLPSCLWRAPAGGYSVHTCGDEPSQVKPCGPGISAAHLLRYDVDDIRLSDKRWLFRHTDLHVMIYYKVSGAAGYLLDEASQSI